MKHLRMLSPLALAAAALMALAGTASADQLTSPPGTQYSGKIVATSFNSTLSTPIANIKCNHSVIEGEMTNQGIGKDISGNVKHLTFNECGHTVTVIRNGTLSLHVNATNEGTLISTGTETTWLFHIPFLGTIHCIYVTNNTVLGSVTGGEPAKLHATSVGLNRVATDSGCGEESTWSADYTFTMPSALHLDDN